MARVNVYLPDDLADAAREADLNVSGITQAALKAALAERDTNRWLDSVARLQPTRVTHAQALDAVHAARDEMGTSGRWLTSSSTRRQWSTRWLAPHSGRR